MPAEKAKAIPVDESTQSGGVRSFIAPRTSRNSIAHALAIALNPRDPRDPASHHVTPPYEIRESFRSL
jgi:hypothetical protein